MEKNLRTMAVGETEANRYLYHRPQADRDQLFFPSKDKVRHCFMTVGFSKRTPIAQRLFFANIRFLSDSANFNPLTILFGFDIFVLTCS